MNIIYSPSTGNFYPSDIEYPNGIPSDAVEVELGVYQTLMNRPEGHSLEFRDGEFLITTPPEIPYEAYAEAELNKARSDRDVILNRLSNMFVFEESESRGALIKVARKALLDFTDSTAVSECKDLPSLKAAIADEFRAACEFDIGLLNGTFAEVK